MHISCAMNNGEHVDFTGGDFLNQSPAMYEDFPNIPCPVIFRNMSTHTWMFNQMIDAIKNAISNIPGIGG